MQEPTPQSLNKNRRSNAALGRCLLLFPALLPLLLRRPYIQDPGIIYQGFLIVSTALILACAEALCDGRQWKA